MLQPTINHEAAEKAIRDFLTAIGQDPEREGLKETPKRVVKHFAEFLTEPDFKFTQFNGEKYDQMVISSKIPFFSLCEHHLLPFFGEAAIGYIPGEKGQIVGISKLPRTLLKHAHKLQNQERITQHVAKELMEKLEAKGVIVVISARHLCQEMRGARVSGVLTTTSCVLGTFANDASAKAEFLNLIK